MIERLIVRGVFYCGVLGALTMTGWSQFGAVGEIPEESGFTFRWVAERDGYVYVLSRDGVLRTFDLTDRSDDGGFQTYSDPVSMYEGTYGNVLLLVEDFLYVFGSSALDIFSLADPAAPAYQGPGPNVPANSAAIVGGHVVAVRNSLIILSIDDPSDPQIASMLNFEGRRPWAVGGGEGYLYVSTSDNPPTESRIDVIDFTDPPNAVSVGSVGAFDPNSIPYQLKVVDSLLVDCRSNGYGFWSLLEPGRPALTYETSSGSGGRACEIYDRYLVTNGAVFDLRPPYPMTGSFPSGGGQFDGSIYGSLARNDLFYLTQSNRILLLKPPPAAALPQYVNGEAGGYQNRSRVILENSGQEEMSGKVIFRSPAGNAAPAGEEEGPPAPVAFALPAQGSFEFTTGGTGSLQAGPAEVRLDDFGSRDLQVSLIYELLGSFVSVKQAGLGREHSTYVTLNDEENTAIAIFNPSPADEAQYEVRLLDEQGVQQLGTVVDSLSPGEQKAIFVTDIFEQIPANFSGRLLLKVINGKPVYSLAIIQRTDGALLSVATLVKP